MIDALLLEEAAEELKKPLSELRVRFSRKERRYLLAVELQSLAVLQGDQRKLGLFGGLGMLAAAAHAFVDSAAVLTKHYGLESEIAENTTEKKRLKGRALDSLLRNAEANARQEARLVKKRLGLVPPEALLYYQAGRTQMKGSFSEKLRSMTHFWRSTMASRVALMVVRRR